MSKEPKVNKEDREAQTERLYAKIGKIAILGEHLNHAMFECSHRARRRLCASRRITNCHPFLCGML
jgi:hypothetical protein